jgi:hypothetical protein
MRPPFRAARTPDARESGWDATASSAVRRNNQRFRRLLERLHQLGPRPVGELLLEVANGRDLIEALEEYARLDPAVVEALGVRDWPTPPIARVA